MKYYIEIDERDIDRFRIDDPCKGSHGNNVLVLEDKNNRTIGFELLKARPHGEWIWQTEDKYRCSVCGENTRVEEVMNEPQYNFCPQCGADMRKEGDERGDKNE